MADYVLLVHGDDASGTATDPLVQAALRDAHSAFARAVTELGGELYGGEVLAGSGTALTVRDGVTRQGPAFRTGEVLAGYHLVRARDLDHAVEMARLCPAGAGVEVRPVLPTPGGEDGQQQDSTSAPAGTRRFAVLLFDDEAWYDDVTDEKWAQEMATHETFGRAVVEAGGAVLGGEALEATATATSIRGATVTDGPFVETKEALGGFYLLALPPDRAAQVAALAPAATVELRPVLEAGQV